MVSPEKKCGKRARPSPSLLDSDDDTRDESHDNQARAPQAERKRELERNRRNLVNVRFTELEAELRRCAPNMEGLTLGKPCAPKTRRIDKEAVLKEAAQRLAVQRAEIETVTKRLASMSAEVENLRAEKVELRNEKAYLRDELQTVRGDVHRLRSDNINLWQAFKKKSSLKSLLSADVAKLPAELFCRPKPQPQLAATAQNALGTSQVAAQAGTHALQSQSQSQSLQQAQQQQQQATTQSSSSQDTFLIYQSADDIAELFTNYVPGTISTANERTLTPAVSAPEPTAPRQTQVSLQQQSPLLFDFQQQQQTIQAAVAEAQQKEGAEIAEEEVTEPDPFSDIAYCV